MEGIWSSRGHAHEYGNFNIPAQYRDSYVRSYIHVYCKTDQIENIVDYHTELEYVCHICMKPLLLIKHALTSYVKFSAFLIVVTTLVRYRLSFRHVSHCQIIALIDLSER